MSEYDISEDNPKVRLAYSSPRDIMFRGTRPTGISRKEWDGMYPDERETVINDILVGLVEIFELNDDEPDY